MKKLLITLTLILTLSSFNTFAETTENIKTSEFITAVIKETYGEQPTNNSKKEYLPYALKAISEGIILPGEIENYDNEIERKIAYQILDRIAEKEKVVGKYEAKLNSERDENLKKYIDKSEFEGLINRFLIKIGKREKKGDYYTLEEIRESFGSERELEDYLSFGILLNNENKYSCTLEERNTPELIQEVRNFFEQSAIEGDEITFGLQDGIFYENYEGETKERNRTLYDISTILNYHAIKSYRENTRGRLNDYDVLVRRDKGATRFVFTNNSLYNSQDSGYFQLYLYDELQDDNEANFKYNVEFVIKALGDFSQELVAGEIDAEGIRKLEYMDQTIPEIVRETLRIFYKDQVDELMNEIIKDYKVMNNNPADRWGTYRDFSERKIMGEDFSVTIYGQYGGTSYKTVFYEK